MSNSGDIAYLVHVFHRRSKGRDQIHAVGRMENGQTVGLVDRCARPVLYLRCEDAAVWEPVVGDGPCAVVDTREIESAIGECVRGVRAGERDEDLVY
ncbi:MAG: hypothetical protein VX670_02380, partial [Candidatus Latescibacterota bacterium]|nr:hypothetical protein [Candidatus Latescibacterota bacterium]